MVSYMEQMEKNIVMFFFTVSCIIRHDIEKTGMSKSLISSKKYVKCDTSSNTILIVNVFGKTKIRA